MKPELWRFNENRYPRKRSRGRHSRHGSQTEFRRRSLERDAFRRNRKGDSFFCANQIHHSGR
ncbi:hypothetical protein CN110_06690 [Sinorhizobium meliloti]|nr:hypothetical protein CN110_06690 [Sinorhizobium meliloti]